MVQLASRYSQGVEVGANVRWVDGMSWELQ